MSRFWSFTHSLFLLGLSGALFACAPDDKAPLLADMPVETIYNMAAQKLDEGDYKKAADTFDEVERQHPYSQWAVHAQLMAAYAHYQDMKYDEAIAAADRFIQLHPGNDDVPYAYYLKGLCYYEQIGDVQRDQMNTQKAMDTFGDLIRRFPDTAYARDAKLKVDLTRDHMAAKEMDIGRYYQVRSEYLAAIQRFRIVVDKYQTTSQTPEALHRIVECYLALGVTDEARKAAAVLGYNYPGSPWYEDSYTLLADHKVIQAQPYAKRAPVESTPAAESVPASTGDTVGGTWFDRQLQSLGD